jgi:hypothetical protein
LLIERREGIGLPTSNSTVARDATLMQQNYSRQPR